MLSPPHPAVIMSSVSPRPQPGSQPLFVNTLPQRLALSNIILLPKLPASLISNRKCQTRWLFMAWWRVGASSVPVRERSFMVHFYFVPAVFSHRTPNPPTPICLFPFFYSSLFLFFLSIELFLLFFIREILFVCGCLCGILTTNSRCAVFSSGCVVQCVYLKDYSVKNGSDIASYICSLPHFFEDLSTNDAAA